MNVIGLTLDKEKIEIERIITANSYLHLVHSIEEIEWSKGDDNSIEAE